MLMAATKKLKAEYLAVVNKRNAVLNGAQKRIAKHRSKLKTDKQKAKKVKQSKQSYYIETKAQGKQKLGKQHSARVSDSM